MAFSSTEAESIAALCLMAAVADGSTADEERARLERVFQLVDGGSHADVHRRVVMGDASIIDEAARLESDAARTMAWEMAVGVCEADGLTTDGEREFLRTLEAALGLDHAAAEEVLRQGEQMVDLALEAEDSPSRPTALDRRTAGSSIKTGGVGPLGLAAGFAGGGVVAGANHADGAMTRAAASPPGSESATASEIDATILRYSIMNGAIELLPEDLATAAILPLQMRMVYLVGREHGHRLSAAHIKEFLAVAGVGMTSQVLEGYARKLFGKMAKRTLGRTAGKVAGAATGAAMTFATTYGLGQVAKQYYGGGRTLSAVDLRGIFQRASDEGQRVYQEHAGAVEQRARGLDMGTVMNAVRGKAVV